MLDIIDDIIQLSFRCEMNTFRTGSPVVKREIKTLFQVVEVGGIQTTHSFEREILWLQETETTVEFHHGDKLLRAAGTTNDFYGYFTSVDIENAESIAKSYSINPDSSLELLLSTRVYLKPAYESPEDAAKNASIPSSIKAQYSNIPNNWRTDKITEAEFEYHPMLERIDLSLEKAWSSKLSIEENRALLVLLKAKWATPVTEAKLLEIEEAA